MKLIFAVFFCMGWMTSASAHEHTKAPSVVAITVALDPNAEMVRRAVDANARLRTIYPDSFTLDLHHRPHLTLLQRFVRTRDLEKVYAAISSVLLDESPGHWQLTAYKLGQEAWGSMGVAMIYVEKTPDLLRLQRELIDQLQPLAVKEGSSHALVGDDGEAGDKDARDTTVEHVARFVPNSSGGNYEPNVTVGAAPPESLSKFLVDSFASFNFAPVSLSVYQLGAFGAARVRLKTWALNPL